MKSKAFILSLLSFYLLSCRQSNKDVFEEFTDITIPSSAEVIKDEYQDMGQNFGKVLELQLDPKSVLEIKLSISKSRFFNASAFINNNVINPELMRSTKKKKGVWYREPKGYAFYGSTNDEREDVTATIDTAHRIAKFQYLAD
jgi:hypothetical protein